MPATIYLIPTVLVEEKTETIPAYVLEAVKKCSVFYVENERTARRFLKLLWREMVIDDYEWHTIKKGAHEILNNFNQRVQQDKTIGIISEAGCPGVADPGQDMVHIAHQLNATIKPLVGPSSILLAVMGSGMNGQRFQFVGYLPLDVAARLKMIRQLESESRQKDCTQVFIETPYRNNQLLETLIKTCEPKTQICVAADLTGDTEYIKTKTVTQWKTEVPQLHKRLVIFALYSGGN